MASTCNNPTCPEGCEHQLPEVKFSICAPEINFAQVAKMYMTNDGYPLTDENDLAEWQTRANLDVSDPSRVLELSIVGDKPLPTANEVQISRGRTAKGLKDFVLNIAIDETNPENYEFMRRTECGMTARIWYETYGGLLYGGKDGILATVELGEEITGNTADIITFKGTAKWKAKHHPCRTTSPMAGIDLVAEEGS